MLKKETRPEHPQKNSKQNSPKKNLKKITIFSSRLIFFRKRVRSDKSMGWFAPEKGQTKMIDTQSSEFESMQNQDRSPEFAGSKIRTNLPSIFFLNIFQGSRGFPDSFVIDCDRISK